MKVVDSIYINSLYKMANNLNNNDKPYGTKKKQETTGTFEPKEEERFFLSKEEFDANHLTTQSHLAMKSRIHLLQTENVIEYDAKMNKKYIEGNEILDYSKLEAWA